METPLIEYIPVVKNERLKGGVQPKTQLSKTKRAVAERRRHLRKLIAAGMSQYEAGKAVGYTDSFARVQPSRMLNSPQAQREFQKSMEKNIPMIGLLTSLCR
jgi:hypothetical protein